MPRKPHGRYHSLRSRHFGFSSFARSMSIASSNKKKRQAQTAKLQEILAILEFQGVFVGSCPKPNDFHRVKVLLQTYLDNKEWDLSGFVDLIVGQTTVGTVVRIEDDEDENVYSVASALNLDRYKDQRCIKELKDFLLESCLEKNVLSDLTTILGEQAQGVGLLVSRHFVNFPHELLPDLYKSLFRDISEAKKKDPTEELRKSFCFKHYLMVTEIFVLQQKHSNKKSRSSKSKSENEAVIYIKPEDEIFFELSSWSFNFPLRRQGVTPKELKNFKRMGLVMAVEASKIPAFQQQLKSFSIVES